MRQSRTFQISVVANLAALSVLLYYFIKFPLPFIFPAFLDIQFSNVPAIIGGFMFGPWAGGLVVIVRTLVKLPASTTVTVGEFADLIIGLPTVLASSFVYMKMRTKKGAIIASIVGIIVWVAVSVIGNYFLFIPFYLEYYFQGNVEGLLNMLAIVPGINETNYLWRYTVFTVIPFNALLASIVYGLTFLIYKRIHHLIDAVHQRIATEREEVKTNQAAENEKNFPTEHKQT